MVDSEIVAITEAVYSEQPHVWNLQFGPIDSLDFNSLPNVLAHGLNYHEGQMNLSYLAVRDGEGGVRQCKKKYSVAPIAFPARSKRSHL